MKKPALKTLLVGIALFLFFFVCLFPYSKLRGLIFSQIYSATQIYVNSQSLSPALLGWPGVRLKHANVILPAGDAYLNIVAETATARVGLMQLIPPRPSVSLALDNIAGGGSVFARGGMTTSGAAGRFQVQQLALNPYYIPALTGAFQGDLTADGEFNFDEKELPKSTGHATLALRKFKIPSQNLQGIILPAFFLGEVTGQIQVRNGAIEIGPFQIGSKNTEIRGTISGDIRLAQSWMECFLNLIVKIQLADSYRNDGKNATLVSFLKTFENTPGDYGLKWSATFRDLGTNIAAAIPQKAN